MSIPAAKIFLMIGINDILNAYQADDITENLQLIMENIKTQSNRSQLVMQSILPVNEQMLGSTMRFNEMISGINASIMDYCGDCQVEYLNLYPSFLEGSEMSPRFTTDGAHLSTAGYTLWAEKLRALLD